MTDNKTQLLTRSLLFTGLAEPLLSQLVGIAQERHFGRGETIFFEGDIADGFYVISQGQVKVFKMSLGGTEQILHIFGLGEPVGEAAVFSGQPGPATAISLVPSSALFFPRKDFANLISASPDLALSMLAVLSRRLRQRVQEVAALRAAA